MLKKVKNHFKTPKGFGQLVNTMAIFAPQKAAKLAFKVFCTPRKGRTFTPSQEKLLAKAQQEKLQLHDFELQTYVWQGGDEKVLLVHGWDSNAARWKTVINLLLKANYTVISFDAPAHGRSGSDIITGVLYGEAVEKVMQRFEPHYVVGHSFGGMAVAHYFANFEALPIKRMILMATPSKMSRILEDYYQLINFSKRGQKALEKHFIATFGFSLDYFSVEDFVKKINLNGLVIHDKLDSITPFQEGKTIHQNWKNSDFFIVENMGHSLQNRQVYRRILEEVQKGKS